jgi:4-hydroxy-3-polyprenylbenzoate decarboxylase
MAEPARTVCLAITGASGVQYGFRLLQQMLQENIRVYLMVSKAAHIVIGMETGMSLSARTADLQKQLCELYGCDASLLSVYGEQEWTAPPASGSNDIDAMVVCPCSMGALSAIATGASNNLIERGADTTLKERKKLIIVPRESPYSDIHLENMLKLSRMGAVIVDANPGFYHAPATVDDLVDFVVAKILDQLKLAHSLMPKWGE